MSINSADFNDLPVDDDQALIPDYPVIAWVYGNPAMREASTIVVAAASCAAKPRLGVS